MAACAMNRLGHFIERFAVASSFDQTAIYQQEHQQNLTQPTAPCKGAISAFVDMLK
jgi:hypothetical protein